MVSSFHGIFSDVPFDVWDSRSKRRSKQSQQICWKFFVGVVKHVAQRANARCHTLWQEVWLVVDSRKNERDIFHYHDSIDILWFFGEVCSDNAGSLFQDIFWKRFLCGFLDSFSSGESLARSWSCQKCAWGEIRWDLMGSWQINWCEKSGLISNIDSWESLVAMIWHLQMRISW